MHRRTPLAPSAPDMPSLDDLAALSCRCRTPKQFRRVLHELRTVIPYQSLICGWGYPPGATVGFMFNDGVPVQFLRWYLSKGMLRKAPMFHEWLRTRKTQVWLDVAKRLKQDYDPELIDQVKRFRLQYSLAGGVVDRDVWIHFSISMGSEQSCRAYLKPFGILAPALCQALKQACPRPLLSARETAILERRALGQVVKRIASAEGISARTVRMHLQRVKRKLYTDDLVNAVVIAVRSGMIDRTWQEWRWRNEHRRRT